MNTRPAFDSLKMLEDYIDSFRPYVQTKRFEKEWQRDKRFIEDVRNRISSEDIQNINWILYQQKGLDEGGFGFYCGNDQKVDALLDGLYLAVQELLLSR